MKVDNEDIRITNHTTIKLYTEIEAPIQVVFDCARSIEVHERSTAKTNEKAIAGKTYGLCELGDQVTWRAKHFGMYQQLTAKITEFEMPHYFQDCMVKGAFAFFVHDHYLEEKDGVTFMKDVFRYGVPYGILGRWFNNLMLSNYMTRLLTERNQVIKEVAETKSSKN